MSDLLVASGFVLMVFAPCLVALQTAWKERKDRLAGSLKVVHEHKAASSTVRPEHRPRQKTAMPVHVILRVSPQPRFALPGMAPVVRR